MLIAIEFGERREGEIIKATADEARWLAVALTGAADALERENKGATS